MSITWLSAQSMSRFPPVDQTTEDGLLAAGGDLSPDRLLAAYQHGIFPWFNKDDPILWWCPDPRMVLFTDSVKISKSLRKTIQKQALKVTFDKSFQQVMQACAAPRRNHPTHSDSHTWIHDDMLSAYQTLHQLGYAHSVECWQGDKLVGGLYGIAIGRMFFGESMFSLVTDSSKIALVTLCQQLQRWQVPLIDCQIYSDHLATLGAVELSRHEFISRLEHLCQQPALPSTWQIDDNLPVIP